MIYPVPLIFICSLVGSYALDAVMYDLITCAVFGFIGYLMLRYDYPVSPMVLAQILGFMMESNFRRALAMSRGDVTVFLTRPITMVILALAIFTTIMAIRRRQQALKMGEELARRTAEAQ